jgi:type VI secretion system secreted protein VgrG
LGGQTLGAGLYNATSSLGITGTLTLNGTATSIFIFQIGTALTVGVGSQVVLTGGAQAANVFWQVGSSATLNTNAVFVGTILAQASISLGTGASLNGRALARTGAVTLLSNTIVQPGPPVTGAPSALSVVCPNSAAQVGTIYSSLVVAMGGTPPYTYSITGSLPAGLTLNPSTGVVMGTPLVAGPDPFTVNAGDSALGTAIAACSITSGVAPATTPAPSSLILVLIGLACAILHQNRERWLSCFKKS